MQCVALSFYRFEGWRDRVWAFSQMGLARAALARLPGVDLFRLFGSGTGEGFNPRPNWGVYALMTAWPDEAQARKALGEAAIFNAYDRHAAERWTLYLRAVRCWGVWAGTQPFAVSEPSAPPSPIAILTRATIKPRHVVDFWRSVPMISRDIPNHPDMLFKIGIGEIPWLHQVTFSIWPDIATMEDFSRNDAAHGEGIRRARQGDWFAEQLFARFAILGSDGSWQGRDPLHPPAPMPQSVEERVQIGGHAHARLL